MPTYDYRCESNGRVVEVNHRMSENIDTWGQLCAKAGIEPGDTPAASPVARLANGGHLMTSGSAGSGPDLGSCSTGACCPGGMCGLD